MKIPIYQIDAFATDLFAGNPAAVCPLKEWPSDDVMQSIAAENNLSETAFLVPHKDGCALRWFTPTVEVALCGHATLAAAFVVFNCLGWTSDLINFYTNKSGVLSVVRTDDQLVMNFPQRKVTPLDPMPELESILGGVPVEHLFGSEEDMMAVVKDEGAVFRVAPDFAALQAVTKRGLIVTAQGSDRDFVSRFFAPAAGIPEDPVTGSAHCVLAPYWAEVLGKNKLHARQVSRRGGELRCILRDDRVYISGQAVLYMEGFIRISP